MESNKLVLTHSTWRWYTEWNRCDDFATRSAPDEPMWIQIDTFSFRSASSKDGEKKWVEKIALEYILNAISIRDPFETNLARLLEFTFPSG